MKKKILILVAIVILLIGSVCGTIFFMKFNNSEELTSYFIQNVLKPYVRIEKNEELSSTNFTLNNENKEIYYYFDVYNYDKETDEFSSTEITPYVKINLNSNDENNNLNFVNLNLYYLKDASLGLVNENIEEITAKGDSGSGYEDYFKCKKMGKYNEDDDTKNISHYLAKITLNTEDEKYNNLNQNISEKIEIILGYKK